VSSAAVDEAFTVLYFFSSDRTSCKNIEPIVKDLSGEYKMLGMVYAQGDERRNPTKILHGVLGRPQYISETR
jgi:hypothetical protein